MSAKAIVTVQITFELSEQSTYHGCTSWEQAATLHLDSVGFYNQVGGFEDRIVKVEIEGADPWE